MFKKFSSAALAVAFLFAPYSPNNIYAKASQSKSTSSNNNSGENSSSGSSVSQKHGLIGYTTDKFKLNGVATGGLNGGLVGGYHGTGGAVGGFGFGLGVGYQMIYKTKSKYNLYAGADFSYDMLGVLGGQSTIDAEIASVFGLKLRVGASMLKDTLKTYFTFGLMGFAYDIYQGHGSVSSFMPVFGLGIDKSILKRKLSWFIELEGGPTTGDAATHATNGIFLMKSGVRFLF